MTPADICSYCNGCRSIHQCRAKASGRPKANPPAAPTKRRPLIGPFGALAILGALISFALPILSLAGAPLP